ncbi:MAG: decarboxylase [Nanoarchaeota archaeon]|nr:decarboxylase [Nanoarchaeota archaeon]
MPKFILSKSIVLDQYKKLEDYADIVSYSAKTNPAVGKILEKDTNCVFSVHLNNELRNINDWSRVFFLVQAITTDQLEELIQKGVKWFVVDNEEDLSTIITYLNRNDVQLNLLLRLKLQQHTIRTEKYYLFGMEAEIIKKHLKKIREDEELSKKMLSLGVHFHRTTQNMSEWNMKYEVEEMLGDVLEHIDIINIGGGIPSKYANTNADVIKGVLKKILEFKEWSNKNNIKLMIEPGRFIAAPAIKLQTKILQIHGNTIIADASVYSGDLDALIVPVKLLVEGELSKEEGDPFIIKGITPCQLDLFRYRVYLKNPKKGDTLTFLNAGAYNFASDFCELDKIETEIK